MAKSVGVTLSEQIHTGFVVDHKLVGGIKRFPKDEEDYSALVELHTDALVETICDQILAAANGEKNLDAVGIAVPGLVKSGVVEEAPNLPQLKGARLRDLISMKLHDHGIAAPVTLLNDADGVAAGLAARFGKLDSMIRVWTIGLGIGHGRYPHMAGVWEGGHSVVTLDDKETFCGCGGRGHLEGIMGHRAMRLRFLDMEPEEVFEEARKGDIRCLEFKRLYHKALAAATATSIHMAGPGKFFLTGTYVDNIDLPMLKDYMQQMVKMSPLQGYSIEVVEENAETRVIGSAVSAEQAAGL
ncbi:ROK family protein [Edaphobacter flagellatus]|uniref:ROK family protein n=1 Tax=Edaphobacter flagellatus TaxID=1933044 RepID=UPI0021B3F14A|nr:ROK family protein [Edaphobacter flagellatus]